MRTRFINKMTSEEVEEYLKYNDVLFVAVGTVENHGDFPMDVNATLAEAIAKLFAEESNAAAAGNLPYFLVGETGGDAGTIEVDGDSGVRYLKELAYSFLAQGFRHQVYITGQGPIFVMIGNLVIDFFDESKDPISFISLPYLLRKAMENDPTIQIPMDSKMRIEPYYEELLFAGAYEVLGRKKELVIDPKAVLRTKEDVLVVDPDVEKIIELGGLSAVGYYQENMYGDFGAFPDEETRDRVAAEGAELLRKCCKAMNVNKYLEHLDNLDKYTQTEIKAMYAGNLPKNRFSEWK